MSKPGANTDRLVWKPRRPLVAALVAAILAGALFTAAYVGVDGNLTGSTDSRPLSWPDFALGLSGILVSLAITLISVRIGRETKREARLADEHDRQATDRALEAVSRRASDPAHVDLSEVVREEIARLDPSPGATEVLNDLAERLGVVENRMPDRSTVDKLESVNDAIMATKIEALERDVQRLSDSALTKWNVATIVFGVLTALGALVSIIVGLSSLS